MRLTQKLTKLMIKVWQEVNQQGESFIQVNSLDDICLYREIFQSFNSQVTLYTFDLDLIEDWFESEGFDDHYGPEVRLVEPDGNGSFLLEEVDLNTRVSLTEKGWEHLRQRRLESEKVANC